MFRQKNSRRDQATRLALLERFIVAILKHQKLEFEIDRQGNVILSTVEPLGKAEQAAAMALGAKRARLYADVQEIPDDAPPVEV
jgi:hypothetical protein